MLQSIKGRVAEEVLELRTGEWATATGIGKTDWATFGTSHFAFHIFLRTRLAEKMYRAAVATRHAVDRKLVETAQAVLCVS
jgi:hypothetical protein